MPVRAYTSTEIDAWRKEAIDNPALVKEYRRYLRNDHPKTMTPEQQRQLGRRGRHPVADNVLKLVIRTAASRTRLTGLTAPDDAVQAFLDDLWTKNRMDAMQYAVAFATLRDGNHAVSLRWNNEASRVTLHRERWWDGTEGVFIAYDDYGDAVFAVKEWAERDDARGTEVARRTVYYPDEIHRLRKEGGGWELYSLPTDPDGSGGILPWRKTDGTPLGIPVIHFSNGLETDDEYGVSDVAGLLGLQDDLNGMQRDITAASAFTAYQMYLFTGVSTQEAEKLMVGPGTTFKLSNPNADGKAIPAGSVLNLAEAHSYKRSTIAIDTSTPIHVIAGGEWPSGAALLRAEMPLIDKVTGLQAITGPSWTTVAHRATELANTFGSAALNEDVLISAKWDDAGRVDELTRIEIDQAKADLWQTINAITSEVILKKTGLLDDDEIAALIAEREEATAEAAQEDEEGLTTADGARFFEPARGIRNIQLQDLTT